MSSDPLPSANWYIYWMREKSIACTLWVWTNFKFYTPYLDWLPQPLQVHMAVSSLVLRLTIIISGGGKDGLVHIVPVFPKAGGTENVCIYTSITVWWAHSEWSSCQHGQSADHLEEVQLRLRIASSQLTIIIWCYMPAISNTVHGESGHWCCRGLSWLLLLSLVASNCVYVFQSPTQE